MSNFLKFFTPILVFGLFPQLASADVIAVINLGIGWFNALTILFASLAVLAFFWGLVKFIWNAGDERTLEEGKLMMIWGLVGIGIIFCLWAIVGFIQDTLSIGGGGGGTTPSIPITL